jgi:two-component system OmpR family sensor kinase
MTASDDLEMRRAVRRLSVQFTALIAVLFLLLGALVYGLVSRSASESLDRTLRDAAQVDSPRDLPSGVWIMIVDDDNHTVTSRELPSGLPDAAALEQVRASGQTLETEVSSGEHRYRVVTTMEHGGLIQAAVDEHEANEELSRLLSALFAAGIAALVVSSIAATWMARRAIRPLADALSLQRRFVADASHELRTPLTLLSTRAQLLRRQLPVADDDPVLRAGLDEIVQDAGDLTATLEDLLIAADPREVATFGAVDLAAVARDTVASFQAEASSRNIELPAPADGTTVVVSGTEPALQRMLVALVENALDHARSRVQVAVEADGRQALLTVADDGPGFPPDVVGRAFERFATARPAEAEPAGPRHYGLGLALVAEVATRHGGSVAIAPNLPSGGASIRVRIPLLRTKRPR